MMTRLMTAALVMFTVCACSSSASIVRRDATGGRVALDGAYMPAMREAQMLMLDHCAGRYDMHELGDRVDFVCHDAAPEAPASLALATPAATR